MRTHFSEQNELIALALFLTGACIAILLPNILSLETVTVDFFILFLAAIVGIIRTTTATQHKNSKAIMYIILFIAGYLSAYSTNISFFIGMFLFYQMLTQQKTICKQKLQAT